MVDFIKESSKTHADIPYIVVSGCVTADSGENAKGAGADAFLAKPFDPLEFASLLREVTIARVLE